MMINISPSTYVALCGLVMDAMQQDSDAAPILNKAAVELANAVKGELPSEVAQNQKVMEAIERTGWRQAA